MKNNFLSMKLHIPAISFCFLVLTSLANAQSQTFNYTGAAQTYTVPACVYSLEIELKGASGGGSQGQSVGSGGKGGRLKATISVVPGEVLNIFVGQAGAISTAQNNAGWNGGGIGGTGAGDGGGATDIRRGGLALTNRIAVAGGGGGAGLCSTCTGKITGGDGGDTIAANGFYTTQEHAAAGRGGDQMEGGIGGVEQNPGAAGALGLGGNGGGNYGGGGGAGYFGGGGGATNICCWGGGGGGGSSYVIEGSQNIAHTRGNNTGNGVAIITPNAPGPFSPGKIIGMDTICQIGTATFSVDSDANVSSYTWIENNNFTIVSGQGTSSVQILSNAQDTVGSIGVMATNDCGSSDTTYRTFVYFKCDTIPQGLSPKNWKQGFIGVSPNPSTGFFKVDLKEVFVDQSFIPKTISMEVYDLEGRLKFQSLRDLKTLNKNISLDLDYLDSGFYLLVSKISDGKDLRVYTSPLQLMK